MRRKYTVLQDICGEENEENNGLASLGHKIISMSTLFKLRNEIARFVQDIERIKRIWIQNSVKERFLQHTLLVEIQKAILPYVEESITLLEISSHKFKPLRDEVESILINSGHCDPADLFPYLDKDNQDQLVMLKIISKLLYPDGISHFNENPIGSAPSCNTTENQITTEPLNMSCDSTVIETEIPKSAKENCELENSRFTTKFKTVSQYPRRLYHQSTNLRE